MSVQVAVRVRPLSQKEIDSGEKICIEMQNKSTRIHNFHSKDHTFTFDYSFYSRKLDQNNSEFSNQSSDTDDQTRPLIQETQPKDSSKPSKTDTNPNLHGNLDPTKKHPNKSNQTNKTSKPFYAKQNTLFEHLGRPLIQSAMKGFNCCIFAYGQTGSGKSFSMMGDDHEHGLIPRMIGLLFDSIQQQNNNTTHFKVLISMLEIYNEKVQDLLVNLKNRPEEGLKLKLGEGNCFFVKNLSWKAVAGRSEVLKCLRRGNRHRSVAATQMNAVSSRAHTIVTLKIERRETIYGNETLRFSEVHLVDLAGSEKVGKTGVTGQRLREGCHINKSLSCLGRTISVLADQASGMRLKEVVPYRESPLTLILKNALGGNARTVMLCTLSPALRNFQESLSTLKYAMRAKNIKCKAIINESKVDRKIRLIKEENEKLKLELKVIKEELVQIQLMSTYGESSDNSSKKRIRRYSRELDFQITDFNIRTPEKDRQLKASQIKMSQIMEKLEKTQKKVSTVFKSVRKGSRQSMFHSLNEGSEEENKPERGPCLVNITENKSNSGKYEYDLRKIDKVTLTNFTEGVWNEDKIIWNKGHVQPDHAVFTLNHQGLPIVNVQNFKMCKDQKANHALRINGEPISGETRGLKHRDRIVIGKQLVFVVDLRGKTTELLLSNANNLPDYESIIAEIKSRKRSVSGLMIELKTDESEEFQPANENQNKILQLKASLKKREKIIKELDETNQGHQKMLFSKDQRIKELESLRSTIIFDEDESGIVETGNSLFPKRRYSDLSLAYKTAPKRVKAMNILANKTKRKVRFSYIEGDISEGLPHKVRVDNMEMGWADVWDIEKFFSRYRKANDMVRKKKRIKRNSKTDPFYDTPDFVLIGSLEQDLLLQYQIDEELPDKSKALFQSTFDLWNQNLKSGKLDIEINSELTNPSNKIPQTSHHQSVSNWTPLATPKQSIVHFSAHSLSLNDLKAVKFYFKIELQNKISRQCQKFRSQVFEPKKMSSTGSSLKKLTQKNFCQPENISTSCRFDFDDPLVEISCLVKVFGVLKASPNFLIEAHERQLKGWVRDSELFIRRSKVDKQLGGLKTKQPNVHPMEYRNRMLGTGLEKPEVSIEEQNLKIDDKKICCVIF